MIVQYNVRFDCPGPALDLKGLDVQEDTHRQSGGDRGARHSRLPRDGDRRRRRLL